MSTKRWVNWCCWRCGRWGTKQFMVSYRPDGYGRMECSNDRACQRRRRQAALAAGGEQP